MKAHQVLMETAKLTDFLYSLIVNVKTGNISKVHNLVN